MSKEIMIIAKDGQKVVSSNTVMEGSGATGKPLIIKAKPHMAYELKNAATHVAPDQVHVTREGNNLKIHFGKKADQNDDSADIIIEGYYDNGGSLIGVAENGQYYHFIAQGADSADSYYSLGGPVIGTETETDWTTAALGALALGAIAAAAGGGGGGHPDTVGPERLSIAVYDDGEDGKKSPEELIVSTEGSNMKSAVAGSGIPLTNDNTPLIKGNTEAGATVTIKDGTTTLGTVTADGNGDYKFTPTAPLADGIHYISATAADAAGNSITESTTVFEIDATAPGIPTVKPTDGSPITGTAEAGSTVTITDDKGNLIGTDTADGNGNYSVIPTVVPVDGTHLVATATDAAGNVSDPGTGEVNSAVPDAPHVWDDIAPVVGVIVTIPLPMIPYLL